MKQDLSRPSVQRGTAAAAIVLSLALMGAGCGKTTSPTTSTTPSGQTAEQPAQTGSPKLVTNTDLKLSIECVPGWTCDPHMFDGFTVLNAKAKEATLTVKKSAATSLDAAHKEMVDVRLKPIIDEKRTVVQAGNGQNGEKYSIVRVDDEGSKLPSELNTIITLPVEGGFANCIAIYNVATTKPVVEELYAMCKSVKATQ